MYCVLKRCVFGSKPPHTYSFVTLKANVIYTKVPDCPSGKALAKSLQRNRGFESHIWHFLIYKVYFNVAHFCFKVLSEPRRVTLPAGNNLEMTSLYLAPRVVLYYRMDHYFQDGRVLPVGLLYTLSYHYQL